MNNFYEKRTTAKSIITGLLSLAAFMTGTVLSAQTFPTPTGFTLPAGKTIVITYDVDVNSNVCPAGTSPTDISNQSNVSGSNFATVQTDEVAGAPITPTLTPVSGLTLGNLVYKDNNINGVFDGGDAGIDNVLVRLYADDGDGVLDAGDGAALATATTAGGGLYSFTPLCPGNYIVEVAASNFNPGGPLYNNGLSAALNSSPIGGAPDPDNDLNNDDNGDPVAGFGVASQAITLAYGTEPITDGDTDPNTNLTLDFGFKDPTTVTINDVTMNEGTGGTTTSFSFTVSRSSAGETFNLTVNTMDGTATTLDNDYTAISGGTVMFGPTGLTQTVTVLVNHDNKVENNETFSVVLSGAPAGIIISDGTGLGTITNDDAATVTLSGNASQLEGNAGSTPYVITLTLDNPVQGGFMIMANLNIGTATFVDGDFNGPSVGFTFTGNAGEAKTMTATINGDTKVELNEMFSVTLDAPTSAPAGVNAGSSFTGTITNDDAATVSFSGSVSQSEAITPQAFTVNLSNPVDVDVTLDVNTTDASAQNTEDYSAIFGGTVTFLAGTTTPQTVNVVITNDNKVEANEQYTLGLSNLNASTRNVSLVAPSLVTGTIENDDAAIVTLSGGGSDYESSFISGKTFTATLNNPVQGGFSIAYNTNDGTATLANNDYQDNDGTLTFSGTANEMETFIVTVVDDGATEPDETFTTTLGAVSGTTLGSSITTAGSPQTYTILNDDQTVSISVLPSSVLEDGPTNLDYTFTRTGFTVDSMTVFFSVGGTATFTTDYAQSGASFFNGTVGYVHFTFNQTSKVVTINPVADMTAEPDETVVLTITPTPRFNIAPPGNATGTIEDDDNNVSVVVAPGTTAEDGSTNLVYTFTRTDVNTGALVVNFSVGGSATLTSDYAASGATTFTPTTGTVTFSGTSPTATVTIDPVADLIVEDNETVVLTVTSGVGYGVGSPSIATGTIDNDDTATLTFSGGNSESEPATPRAFNATLSAGVQGGFKVAYTTNNGSTNPATAGTDYTDNDGDLTFAGSMNETQTVNVIIANENLVELDETFTVVLGAISMTSAEQIASITIVDGTQTETILNDDGAVVSLAGNVTQAEAAGPHQYSVTLTNPVDVNVTVNFATSDNTATAGSDYTAVNQTVTFLANTTTTQMVNIPVGDENIVEDNEWIDILLSSLSAGGRNVSLGTAVGLSTINNDDNAVLTLTASGPPFEGDSGTSSFNLTATLSAPVQGGFNVAYFTNDGTATAPSDFSDNDGTLTFAGTIGEPHAWMVNVNGDVLVELDENFMTGLGALSGTSAVQMAAITISDSPKTLTIKNDDNATISIASNVSQLESVSPQTFNVTLSNPVDVNVTVEFSTSNGSATTADNDYSGISNQLVTFLANTTNPQPVNVTINDDTTVEADEVFNTNIANIQSMGRSVALGTSTRTGTILNDDAEVAVAVSPTFVNEDGASNLEYTFTRTGYAGNLLNIGFNVGGTATFGTDYSQIGASTYSTTAGTVAMAANSTMASVIIDPTADFLVENNETVILTVVSGTGYNAGTPNSATGPINNDEIDFGDTPDTYSTLLASNGARHATVFGVQLGSNIDGENDGQPNADGTGDDVDAEGDDDDGVTLPAALIAATTANITVNASTPGFLNAWVDFNGNNNFADAGEQVFTNQTLTAGDNALTITMPSTVYQGLSFTRFRFNTTGALSYNGLAADGEVEDYQVQLINTQFTINDTMVVEGNAATTNLVFTVTRSNNASACSIDYAITGGTASPLGGGGMGGADYQALASGTLNFTAGGATSAPVIVTVNGDQTVELDETVVMTLSNPVSANILDGEGTGTITNDDAATITINSPSIAEGDNGNSTLTFDIAMSNPADANVSFNFGTMDGTATAANSDYIGIGGSHTLAPGEQNKQVFQAVVGDCTIEPDEAFSVVLSSLSTSGRNVSFSGGGATLSGTGTILNDDALPVITCSSDFSQNTDAGVCQATVTLPQPGTSSICGSGTLEFRYRPVNAANQPTGPYSNYAPAASNTVVFQKGKYEIEWHITDGSGSSVCSHFLTVVDNEAPVAVCKNITVQLSTSGTVVIAPAQVDNVSSDNCAFSLSLNTTTFSCANVGPNTVTLTATDPSNLTHSCNATVTVEDNVAPVALCKNVTVQLDANGDGSITASQVNNGSSDACGIQSLSVTPYIFTCANVGSNTVTLTVTDVNNNSASCNTTVTVEDKVKPVALCQNLTITLNADGTKTVTPSQINNGSSDACGIAGMSLFPNVFSCNNIGVNNTTLTVTDVNGNSNTCTATVTVNEFVVITNITTTPESCTGNGDGTITIEATTLGGVLQYSINGGASYSFSNVFTGLTPGSYSVKVRAQGTANCGDTASATVGAASGGAQTWYKDWDNDGYSDGTTQVSCTQPNGYKLPASLTATSGDCNDNDPLQFPGQTWYKDSDNDGYSNGTVLISCTKPAGYKSASQLTQTSGDCNDNNAAIRPGATETCNGVDDNCNGQIDEGLADLVYNGNVVLTTQAQVNAFSQCYTVINGNLTVQNAGISNINTLSNIHKVTGHVLIKQTSLTSLAGLSSLDSVGGNLTINNNIYGSKLNTLDGLEILVRVGGNLAIFSNLKLSDCCAIHDLLNTPGAIGGNTSIYSNLTGCESVSGINTACGAPNSLVGPININLWVDILFDKQGSSGVYSMYDADEDQINMTIKGQFSTGVAKLFDQNGRMVLRQNFQPGNTWFRMMLGQTVPGSYQLEISLDGNVYTKALVIE